MTTPTPPFDSTSRVMLDQPPDRVATRAVMIFLGSTSCDIGVELHSSIDSWSRQDQKHVEFLFMDTNQETQSDLFDGANFIRLSGGPRLSWLPPEQWMREVIYDVSDLTLSRDGAHGELANSAIAARACYSDIEREVRRAVTTVQPYYEPKTTVRVHVVAFLGGGSIGALPVLLAALSTVKRDIEDVDPFLHLILPDKDLTEDPDRLFPWQLRNAYSTLGFLRQVSKAAQQVTVAGSKKLDIRPDSFELAILYQSPKPDLGVQAECVGNNLRDLVADGWGAGKEWRQRYDQARKMGDPRLDARFASMHSKEVTLLSGFFVHSAKEYLRRKWSSGLNPQNRATQSRPDAPKLPDDKKKAEWKNLRDQEVSPLKDALGFLNPGAGTASWEEITSHLESAFLPIVSNVRYETSRWAMTLAGSTSLETHQAKTSSDIGATLSRVRTQLASRTDQVRQGVAAKIRTLLFYDLILSSDQSTCEAMLEMLPYRPELIGGLVGPKLELLPNASQTANEKTVKEVFEPEVHRYLHKLMWNQIADLIGTLEEELKLSIESWRELSQNLKERATPGGALSAELGDPESWTFEATDPTVENILQGASAQNLAALIVDQVYLDDHQVGALAERLVARPDQRVHAATREDRFRTLETERVLAEVLSLEIRQQLSTEHTFLSLMRLGGLDLDWNDRVKRLCDGVTSLDEHMWMDGGKKGGSIASIECVGVEASRFTESIALTSLWDGRCNFQESYPGERLRLKVQKTIVAAPLSYLVVFEDMLTACHKWFWGGERTGAKNDNKWMNSLLRDLRRMYPESQSQMGFMELFRDDLLEFLHARPIEDPRELDDAAEEELPRTPAAVEAFIDAIVAGMKSHSAGLEASIELSSNGRTTGNDELLELSVETGESALVSFTGVGTSAAGRQITLYDWDLDGERIQGTDFDRRLGPGTHEAVLTVNDSQGAQGTASAQIIVRVANRASVPGDRAGS